MIGWPQPRGCRAHQAALVDFATHRAGGPEVRHALDHVDRCRACEDDLAATTLVLYALRRLHEESSRAELGPDGWAHLRARLATTRREPSPFMTSLPGMALAVMLVIAVGYLPAMRGTPVILDDGSAVDGSAAVLRHTSVDASPYDEPGSTTDAAVRVVVPITWRAQDLPRPSVRLGGPRAVDEGTSASTPRSAVEPAVVEPAGTVDQGVPIAAQMGWR